MRADPLHAARELGRRYRSAADPSRFPFGMTDRAIDAAWRASVKENAALSGHRESFVRAVRGRDAEGEGR